MRKKMVLQGLQASSFSSSPPSSPSLSLSRSVGRFSPRGTGLSPAGTGLSLRTRKTNVREPVSPRAGPVSPRADALGDRSRLPGTGCLAGCAALFTGGPVSPIRDRSPRVKLSGFSQNSRDRTFRPEYHLRPSTKCGKVRSTHQTLEPRNLQRAFGAGGGTGSRQGYRLAS
uniref:Uncharacterized protein n=1 Tax=Ananas comosus var. bracteatus TaxID=296719 RepID=A0A6V7NXG7_ANACO|nr:unnamed protein product [Ananas comosus var. bracteatus]